MLIEKTERCDLLNPLNIFSMDEIQQIREIRVLKQLNGHPNIIFLREIIL